MKLASDMDRKLKRLEGKMDVSEFETGSTKLAWECLTKPERILFIKIRKIIEEYGENPPDDVLRENLDLFNKGGEILCLRAFDLFREIVNAFALHDDRMDQFIFWTRFMWFFRETMWIITRNRLEEHKLNDLFGDGEWPSDDDPRWREYDEWLEQLEHEKNEEWEREDRERDEQLKRCIEKAMRAGA